MGVRRCRGRAAVRDAGAAVSALEKWDDAAQLRARLVELAGVIDCSGWAISLSKGQAVVTGPEGQSYAATPDPKNIASAVLFDFALSVAFDRDNTRANYERVCAERDSLNKLVDRLQAQRAEECASLSARIDTARAERNGLAKALREVTTLRDYFAAAALTGFRAHPAHDRPEHVAQYCYQVADAMLAKREATS
jgi:hypothetical protein